VVSAAIETLPVEVRGHDPHLALDGGSDGLDAYRALLADLDRLLADEGRGFFEIGAGQADTVMGLAAAKGFGASGHRDLSGTERVVELFRQ
jgi:release factor glutamine methyltransferase